mgnify:CR=1 FL=1|jgi:hypothetical protein
MRRSTNALEGSPGFNFSTRKRVEEGDYEVTCASHPEYKWYADSETDAIRMATSDMQTKVMHGEV